MVITFELGSKGLPGIVAVLFNKAKQTLVLLFGPGGPRLIGESSIAAVAHLGIPALDLRGDLVKAGVLVPAEFHEQFVLLWRPGPFALPVPLFLEVFSREGESFLLWSGVEGGGEDFFGRDVLCVDMVRDGLMGGEAEVVEIVGAVLMKWVIKHSLFLGFSN